MAEVLGDLLAMGEEAHELATRESAHPHSTGSGQLLSTVRSPVTLLAIELSFPSQRMQTREAFAQERENPSALNRCIQCLVGRYLSRGRTLPALIRKAHIPR